MARLKLNPYGTDWVRPAQGAISITPGSEPLSRDVRALYVGGTGDVTIETVLGDTVTLVGLAAGVVHPISAHRVTSATATDIIGLY